MDKQELIAKVAKDTAYSKDCGGSGRAFFFDGVMRLLRVVRFTAGKALNRPFAERAASALRLRGTVPARQSAG